MRDYNSNYINVVPINSHKSDDYINAFQHCYDNLHHSAFTAKLLQLDNEIYKALIQCIEK